MAFKLRTSYYNAGNGAPITHTIPEYLEMWSQQQPEKEAFVIREMGKTRQAITFGELNTKTRELAAGMIKRGLKKGDPVGLLCSTSLEYAVCEYALARTGAILMRFHVSVSTEDDIKSMLQRGNCKWLIAQPGVNNVKYNILCRVIPGLADHDPSNNLSVPGFPDLEAVFIMAPASFPGAVSWETLTCEITDDNLDMLRRREDKISMDDFLTCFATSGSSGLPKLVAERHSFGLNADRSMMVNGGVDGTDRFILDRPMPYSGGLSSHVISLGLTMVYVVVNAIHREGKELYFRVMKEERCTVMLCFPFLLPDLIEKVDSGEFDASVIKFAHTGGELVQKSLLEQVMDRIPRFFLVYGSTEAGNALGSWETDTLEKRINYTGRCYDGELKVIDDLGNVVPVNTPGELCVRNEFLFLGYWGDEERTREQKDELGWYKTDDMAVMNEDGYVQILGRKQDVICKVKTKIYPPSIESKLLRHPLVAMAIAVGIPHETLHEEICVCIVPKPDVSLTAEEIELYCKEIFLIEDVGECLMPDYVLLIESFPRGSTDKIDRKKTRKMAIARLGK